MKLMYSWVGDFWSRGRFFVEFTKLLHESATNVLGGFHTELLIEVIW